MSASRIVTHYDNLRVSRSAPQEVIRAAYKALAQHYHPDRFPDQAEAERVMKIINVAYEVLSDPEQRRQHDVWIARQERAGIRHDAFQRPDASSYPGNDHREENDRPHSYRNLRENQSSEIRVNSVRNTSPSLWSSFLRLTGVAVAWLIGLFVVGYALIDVTGKATNVYERVSGGPAPGYSSRQSIDPGQLSISYEQYDVNSGIFSGRVENRSGLTLRDFTVEIQILDCVRQCVRVGNRVLSVDVFVGPGEMRDFSSSPIMSLPVPGDIPVFRGNSRFQWNFVSARAG